jgi:prepilin-type N-terminal cleavage/methylation domain-containing protein
MKKAFTLIEIIIVVSILGIISAIIIPAFSNYTSEAKRATAKDNLRILRTFIEVYASNNNGVAPGYPGNDTGLTPDATTFTSQLGSTSTGVSIVKFPENPFNGKSAVKVLGDGDPFPTSAAETDIYGWVYKPAIKTIRLNWGGADSEGVSYFEY